MTFVTFLKFFLNLGKETTYREFARNAPSETTFHVSSYVFSITQEFEFNEHSVNIILYINM